MTIAAECAAAADGLTIPGLLARNAREQPRQPALSGTDTTLTWAELREEVARGLAEYGLTAGGRMMIMMSSRPEHWIVDLAATHLAALPCTAYATLSTEQIAFVTAHGKPAVVVLEGAAELDRWTPVLAEDTSVRTVVVLDPEVATPPGDDRYVRWHELAAAGAELHRADPAVFERYWAHIGSDDALAMMYTSGTTGDPKGVVLSHRNAIYEAVAVDRMAPTPDGARSVSYLPLAHVAERELGIYRALYKALHVSVCPDASEVVQTLAFVRPPAFFGVPRVWEKITAGLQAVIARQAEPQREALATAQELALHAFRLRGRGEQVPAEHAERLAEADARVLRPMRAMLGLDELRWASSGAAPLPLHVLEFLASIGIDVLEVWGMSETTGCATANTADAYRPGSVGKPVPGVELRFGDDGEVFVRGPVVFLGYLDDSGEIVRATDDEGWLATGDIGRVDDEGYLTITDRKKELIITATGKNIAPAKVEGLLRAHPLVGHAVAIGDRRPYLTALIVLNDEAAPGWATAHGISGDFGELAAHPKVRAELDALLTEVNGQLARAEQIKRYEVLNRPWTAESGELTPTLKIKRKVVQERYADDINSLYT
ncbi:long-chain fatty acid--CoA ligase [Saccharopolyspora gloriosae]|uniref:AMP-dependent synthetase/ligase n=1 Tax=Saccharopolyspora gloriosae TaxID=455344 RepID=UPI001FB821A3|nr:AMP-dependent synthetase/ligase [Saccharopolyspora gloriosae]